LLLSEGIDAISRLFKCWIIVYLIYSFIYRIPRLKNQISSRSLKREWYFNHWILFLIHFRLEPVVLNKFLFTYYTFLFLVLYELFIASLIYLDLYQYYDTVIRFVSFISTKSSVFHADKKSWKMEHYFKTSVKFVQLCQISKFAMNNFSKDQSW